MISSETIQEYEKTDMTDDETRLVLRRIAEACVLFSCHEKVQVKWNYDKKRYDTVFGFVSGKWNLHSKVLALMKSTTTQMRIPLFSSYKLFSQAFEDGLRNLIKDGMILTEREFPRNRIRMKYAISPDGISAMKSYESILRILRESQEE